MEKSDMAAKILAKIAAKMNVNLVDLRFPAVFLATAFIVWSASCLSWMTCLFSFVGKLTLATVVASVVSLVFKKPLDRLLTSPDQRQPISPRGKAVFVTGCDTGFGHDLALRLHKYGFHVFAGCLLIEGEGSTKLRKEGARGGLQVVECDVSKWEQVVACVEQVSSTLKEKNLSLWAVVNNAGVAVLSEFEWIPIQQYERMLDINSLGSVRVVKAFLPLLRKLPGRIIIMASMSGRYAIPAFTGYSMSKHAMIALADGLRRELKKFGIQVSVVEPGAYKTNLADSSMVRSEVDRHWSALSESTRQVYGPQYHPAFKDHLSRLCDAADPNVHEPVDIILEAITTPVPELRYVTGSPGAVFRAAVMPLLPLFVQDKLLAKLSIPLVS